MDKLQFLVLIFHITVTTVICLVLFYYYYYFIIKYYLLGIFGILDSVGILINCWEIIMWSKHYWCFCVENKIRETWYHVYRRHFLQQSLTTAGNCRKGFYYYQKGFEESDVSLHIIAELHFVKVHLKCYDFLSELAVCFELWHIYYLK